MSAALFPDLRLPVAGSEQDSRPAPAPGADRIERAWAVLGTVLDPEVPALSICDLGIVRNVIETPDGALEIVLTPTYSGCPATEVIEQGALQALAAAGLGPASVRMQRAPAWTSDWISEQGRRRLQAYGIAAPGPAGAAGVGGIAGNSGVAGIAPLRFVARRSPASSRSATPEAFHPSCPRCASADTECLSTFGSTACKSLYRCRACREPFEYFKPI